MKAWLASLIEEGKFVTTAVEKHFGGMDVKSLNWKPVPEKWSVGQCLHHIITSNETYFPMLKSVILGTYRMNMWERLNPISGFLGKKLRESMRDGAKQKFRSPVPFKPAESDIPADIVQQFVAHQQKFLGLMRQTENADHEHLIVTSPAYAVVTYPLKSCFELLIHHEQRHLGQAQRVKEAMKN